MKIENLSPSMGDKVSVFINYDGSVASFATSRSIPCTIIGMYDKPTGGRMYLLGWKSTEAHPKDQRVGAAVGFIGSPPSFRFSPDKGDYSHAMWLLDAYEVTGLSIPKQVFSTRHIGARIISGTDFDNIKIAYPSTNPVASKLEGKCKNRTCQSTVFLDDAKCWNCGTLNPGK